MGEEVETIDWSTFAKDEDLVVSAKEITNKYGVKSLVRKEQIVLVANHELDDDDAALLTRVTGCEWVPCEKSFGSVKKYRTSIPGHGRFYCDSYGGEESHIPEPDDDPVIIAEAPEKVAPIEATEDIVLPKEIQESIDESGGEVLYDQTPTISTRKDKTVAEMTDEEKAQHAEAVKESKKQAALNEAAFAEARKKAKKERIAQIKAEKALAARTAAKKIPKKKNVSK